jgi:hypothetical protein
MEPKFAVYLVLIEDTADADMTLAGAVESLDRIADDLDYSAASDLMEDIAIGARVQAQDGYR